MMAGGVGHDPYEALRHAGYRRLLCGNVCSALGMETLNVAVSWELYERTRHPASLGFVGLAQFLPVLILALPAGHAADRYSRKWQFAFAQMLAAMAACLLAMISLTHGAVAWAYVVLAGVGVARAFTAPARSALMPQLVPREAFSNAIAWNSGGWQVASTVGPMLAGIIIAKTGRAIDAYFVAACYSALGAFLVVSTRPRPVERASGVYSLDALAAGINFVFSTRLILATITLDLFAVLLGGATALLPIYAKDILNVDARGLGWLRAAPAIGAIVMALVLAHRPPMRHAGRAMLLSVAGFGVATIVFGLSKNMLLSLAALAVLGALDNISIVIRGTLVQELTPEVMRGRVSAVTTIFIVSSNEFGAFESGMTAWLFGPVGAVVLGGIGTLIVVAWIGRVFPELRQLGSLATIGGGSAAQPSTMPLGATELSETPEEAVISETDVR